MEKIKLCTTEAINSEKRKVFDVNGEQILVFSHQNKFHAVSNICPHAKNKLENARIEGDTITCMHHGSCFGLRDGKLRYDMLDEDLQEMIDEDNPPFEALKIYALEVIDENLYVCF